MAVDGKYLGQDNTRISGDKIKESKYGEYTLEDLCKQNIQMNQSHLSGVFSLYNITLQSWNQMGRYNFTYDQDDHIGGIEGVSFSEVLQEEQVIIPSTDYIYRENRTYYDRIGCYVRFKIDGDNFTLPSGYNNQVFKYIEGTVQAGDTVGGGSIASSISFGDNLGWVPQNASDDDIAYYDYMRGNKIQKNTTIPNKKFDLVGKMGYNDRNDDLFRFYVDGAEIRLTLSFYDVVETKTSIIKISTNDRCVRFRKKQSDSGNQYILEPTTTTIDNSINRIGFGDFVEASLFYDLYQGGKDQGNLSNLPFYSLVDGDKDTHLSSRKVSAKDFEQGDVVVDDNSLVLVNRHMQMTTIPKFLIDNSDKLLELPIPLNNVNTKVDGNFIVEDLEINKVKQIDRFGCYPSTYPILLAEFGSGKKKLYTSGLLGSYDYDSQKDLLVLYEQSYKEHEVKNPYAIQVKSNNESMDIGISIGIKSGNPYRCKIGKFPQQDRIGSTIIYANPEVIIDTQLKTYEITNENYYFYEDKIYSDDSHTNEVSLTPLSNYKSIVDSIISTSPQTSTFKLCLANVGDGSHSNELYFDIGLGNEIKKQTEEISKYRLPIDNGAKISLQTKEYFLKNAFQFNNDIKDTNNKNLASDVTCYSTINAQTTGLYNKYVFKGRLDGWIRLHGCMPDFPINCMSTKLQPSEEIKSDYNYVFEQLIPTTDNTEPEYSTVVTRTIKIYDTTIDYICKFGVNLRRYSKKQDSNLSDYYSIGKYKYYLVLGKNAKLK